MEEEILQDETQEALRRRVWGLGFSRAAMRSLFALCRSARRTVKPMRADFGICETLIIVSSHTDHSFEYLEHPNDDCRRCQRRRQLRNPFPTEQGHSGAARCGNC